MADFEIQVREHIESLIKGIEDDRERFATAFAVASNVADQYTKMAYKKEIPDRQIACDKGCDSCCSGKMGEWLTVCEAEYVCIMEMTNGFKPKENGCWFLEDSICSIYQYRPIVCRAMNSYDVEWCKNPPIMYSVGPEGDAPIYHPQYHLVMATQRALCAALDQKSFRLKERLENNYGEQSKGESSFY